jgi:hypothetical protein
VQVRAGQHRHALVAAAQQARAVGARLGHQRAAVVGPEGAAAVERAHGGSQRAHLLLGVGHRLLKQHKRLLEALVGGLLQAALLRGGHPSRQKQLQRGLRRGRVRQRRCHAVHEAVPALRRRGGRAGGGAGGGGAGAAQRGEGERGQGGALAGGAAGERLPQHSLQGLEEFVGRGGAQGVDEPRHRRRVLGHVLRGRRRRRRENKKPVR